MISCLILEDTLGSKLVQDLMSQGNKIVFQIYFRFDALFLDIDPELCKKRIACRKNHPTISEGSREGPAIIDRFATTFINPR
jgi:hypothetical protein